MVTTMFIACLVKKRIACEQSMKCDNLFIDSCPLVVFHNPFLVCRARLGSQQAPARVVDRCACSIGYSMLLCSVSPALRCSCERDTLVFAERGTFRPSCFHLFDDSDIAPSNTYCIVGGAPSSYGPSPSLLLKHCACKALYRRDSATCWRTVVV